MYLYFYIQKDEKTIESAPMSPVPGSYFYNNFADKGHKYHFPLLSYDHPIYTHFTTPEKYTKREVIDLYEETDQFILNFREITEEFPVDPDPKKNSEEKKEVEHFLLKLNWMCMYCRKFNADLYKETD